MSTNNNINSFAENMRKTICDQLDQQDEMLKSINVDVYPTDLVLEEKIEKEFASCQSDSIVTTTKKQVMDKIKSISDQMVKKEGINAPNQPVGAARFSSQDSSKK